MKEYIEKDTALQDMWNALYALEDQREKLHGLDLFERKNLQDGFEAGQQAIVNCPVADVVEERHGQWIPTNATHIQKGAVYSRCSMCNEYVTVLGNKLRYCPNCGAKMDGGINE